jgi:hypothetical protein
MAIVITVASTAIAGVNLNVTERLGSINGQSANELEQNHQLAYAPQIDSFLLIKNDSRSVVLVLTQHSKRPKKQDALRSYGDYDELPGYSYARSSGALQFTRVRYVGEVSSGRGDTLSLFELWSSQNKKPYGFGINLTNTSVNVQWFAPDELEQVRLKKTIKI